MTVPWRELPSGGPVPAGLDDAPGPELKIGAGCFRFCGKYVNLQVISVV